MCVCVWRGGSIGVKKNAIKRKHNFQLESDIISGDKQSLSLLFFFLVKKKNAIRTSAQAGRNSYCYAIGTS